MKIKAGSDLGLKNNKSGGFTLVEVLVALSIISIVLAAGFKSTQSLVNNSSRQSDLLLAELCAQNYLLDMRLKRIFPSVGESSLECEQAGKNFTIQTVVKTTPNPNFRRLETQVLENKISIIRLFTILGVNQ